MTARTVPPLSVWPCGTPWRHKGAQTSICPSQSPSRSFETESRMGRRRSYSQLQHWSVGGIILTSTRTGGQIDALTYSFDLSFRSPGGGARARKQETLVTNTLDRADSMIEREREREREREFTRKDIRQTQCAAQCAAFKYAHSPKVLLRTALQRF